MSSTSQHSDPRASSVPDPDDEKEMDSWRLALLGDGGVGKTALAVQVHSSARSICTSGVERQTKILRLRNLFLPSLGRYKKPSSLLMHL